MPNRATRGCPVKPHTPQGPDQVNVLFLLGTAYARAGPGENGTEFFALRHKPGRRTGTHVMIIIHLLGLAPAGWVAAPDKRADARLGQAPEHATHRPSAGEKKPPLALMSE
jgi:hypothetical protein